MKIESNNFLELLKKEYQEKGLDEALEFLCISFYTILDNNKDVHTINEILKEINPKEWDDSILIGFLCYTNNYDSYMPHIKGLEGRNVYLMNRESLVKRIREHFDETRPEDTDELMKFLN